MTHASPRSLAAALALAFACCGAAVASDANPRRQALERSARELQSMVGDTHAGRITPEQLRNRRRRLERRLEVELDGMPVDLKPGDFREISMARAEMNHAVICSQEFEFFGTEDRPEWGWYPSRSRASTGSTLKVDIDGRTRYEVLR